MEENNYTEIKTDEINEKKETNEIKEANEKKEPNEIKEENEKKEIIEIKETDEKKEINEIKEIKEINEVKEIKETNEIKDTNEKKDTNEIKEINEVKEIKETDEIKEIKEIKEINEIKETDEIKEIKETNEIKETDEIKDEGNSINEINELDVNQNLIPMRKEKIITRKGIIITCILLFFVSILLDLYFVYLSSFSLGMKIALCIIHPLLFVIFLFIPSGLYYEFNYTNNKFNYHKTCIIPYILRRCTRKSVDLDIIEKFKIDTCKFLFFRIFNLYYVDKENNTIKITRGRDRNCIREFSKSVLNIPVKLNCWLKNQDYFEESLTISMGENPGNN